MKGGITLSCGLSAQIGMAGPRAVYRPKAQVYQATRISMTLSGHTRYVKDLQGHKDEMFKPQMCKYPNIPSVSTNINGFPSTSLIYLYKAIEYKLKQCGEYA